MEIKKIPLKNIKPYLKNNKKHPEEQIEKIARSIKEYGFNVPILLTKDGTIIAGHGRFLASIKLELETVPVVYMDSLSNDQIKAYRIADNKTAISEWETGFLMDELKDLQMNDYDLSLTGFDASEINDMFSELEDDEDLKDAGPEDANNVETTIKRGNVILLGDHRLMCGDSTSSEDVGILMQDEKADMCFTDPPYNVNIGWQNNPKFKQRSIENDNMSREEFLTFVDEFMKQLLNNTDGALYICMSCKEWATVMKSFEDNGGHWSSTIIWLKNCFVLSQKDYHSKYEPILYGWREGFKINHLSDRTQDDVWEYNKPSKNKEHPTMKPVELCANAIKNSSKPNDIVLDLFGGSGSTLIAADQLKRKCLMMELDPQYCEVICQRWEKLTNQKREKLRI